MNDESTRDKDNRHVVGDTQESLNEALTALEDMLEAGSHDADAAPDRSKPSEPSPDSDGQYTIPLLDDVVLPGATQAPEGNAERVHRTARTDEFSQALLRRLANEIEVIVHTGIEEAMKQAQKHILRQVKKHMDIVLPEILEEISTRQKRDD